MIERVARVLSTPRGRFVLAFALFCLACALYSGFLSDDALISLRYARRWLDGRGLTFNDGERVEGFTNPLFVVLAAALGALHVDLVLAARSLSFLGGVAILALALGARTASSDDEARAGRSIAWMGGVVLASFTPFAVWSVGGLEQSLLGASAAALVLLAPRATHFGRPLPRRDLCVFGALLAASVWLRADGIVVAGGAIAGMFLASFTQRAERRPRLAIVALFVGLVATAAALLVVGRHAYYGTFVPNTALAKVAFRVERLTSGARYVRDGLEAGAVVVGLALLGLRAWIRGDAELRARAIVGLSVVVPWTAYVFAVGGDIFPAFRQIVPAFAVLALAVPEGIAALDARLHSPRARSATIAVIVALHAGVQVRSRNIREAAYERWEWGGLWVGETLASFPHRSRPLLAVDAAGAVPFASSLPTVDMLGLTDRYLATHPPADFGMGPIGHELGNGAYVLSRHPDLVLFCGAHGRDAPCFRSGIEMVQDPSFAREYHLVRFRGPYGRRASVFVRNEGALGATVDAEAITIPAIQFRASSALRFQAPARGDFVLAASEHGYADVEADVLAGAYRVRLEPSTDAGVFAFACEGIATSALDETGFVAERPTRVRIRFATLGERTTPVRALRIERTGDSGRGARCRPSTTFAHIAEHELVSIRNERMRAMGFADVRGDGFGFEVALEPPRPVGTVGFAADPRTGYVVEAFASGRALAVHAIRVSGADDTPRTYELDLGAEARTTNVETVRVTLVQPDPAWFVRGLTFGP